MIENQPCHFHFVSDPTVAVGVLENILPEPREKFPSSAAASFPHSPPRL
jgi:hypothetical protein